MGTRQWGRNLVGAAVCLGVLMVTPDGRAELKPGDILDQTRWQEAKGMMPEAILQRFEAGQHRSKVIEIPQDALQWSTKFNAATEANQGMYDVNEKNILIEKVTGTWPRFGYGKPFLEIDPADPKAPYKIMYNFFRVLGQPDDIKVNVGLDPQLFAYQGLTRFGK